MVVWMKKRKERLEFLQSRMRIFRTVRAIGKGCLVLSFVLLSAFIVGFSKADNQKIINLKEEEISPVDIYAPFTFSYVDREKTRYYREKRRESVKDVYRLDPQVEDKVKAKVHSALEDIFTGKSKDTGVSSLAIRIFEEIDEERRKEVEEKIKGICSALLKAGIIDSKVKEKLLDNSSFLITVYNPKTSTFQRKLVEQIFTPEDIESRLREQVLLHFPEDRRLRLAVTELIRKSISPNLFFDKKETERRKQEAWNSVPEVRREVKKNQIIVARGQKITRKHLSQLAEIAKRRKKEQFLPVFIGLTLLISVFVGLSQRYIRDFSFPISQFSVFCLLSLVSLVFLLITKGIVLFSFHPLFIPLSFVSMLVSILLNAPVAIFISMPLALLSALISNNLQAGTICFVGAVVGVYALKDVKRRTQLVKAGSLVGAVNFLLAIGFALFQRQGLTELTKAGLWGVSEGFVSAFMVMGFLPLFEHMFKLTTNISLLELSDLNQPLLKRLIMEAPGTYHHSLIVGNLAESASEAVGANSLLARVASYYHDIGKIEKSDYFSENQKGKSRHNKLTATMSSLIIIKHVKDGVEMARKYRLPRQIIEIIQQHHGTSLVPYFYQRALESDKEGKVSEENFRYPGPKPQSKEAAIVMLADAVEAASRSLEDPTPSRLKAMVQEIVNGKFIDHQLDECNLTLTDLSKITQSFTYVLSGIFHTRVKYPGREQK